MITGMRCGKARSARALGGLALAALSIAFVSQSAGAQPQRPLCGSRNIILEQLDKSYSEKPQAVGLSADGGVVEIFASEGGSWTVLITYPNRTSCMILAGRTWET
jgi:hypothetical protein